MSTHNESTVKFELTEAKAKLLVDELSGLVRDLRVGQRASNLSKLLTDIEVQRPPHLGDLGEKFSDLQESEVGGWALGRLTDQATAEVVAARRGGGLGVQWSRRTQRLMEAIATLLDEPYDAVNSWVSDVCFDLASEELADAEARRVAGQ